MSEQAHTALWLQEDPPVAPDLTGKAGRAWRWHIEDAPADVMERTAGVGNSWLLDCPGSHPFWPWHVLLAVSLEDRPGLPPAHRQYPEAEWEVMVLALNPEHPVPDPRHYAPFQYLQPADVVLQLHNVPEGAAGVAKLLELCALACVDGHLIPDEDYRGAWQRSVHATLQHVREGRHGL